VLRDEEILALLGDPESDRVERTTSTGDTGKFCEAICAFSNDLPNNRQPGYLMVGANNDGSLAGLSVTDELLLYLGGLRSDGNIQPIPSMAVEKRSLVGGDLAVVTVMPSDLPPVRYKGRVWIRVGPQRAVASEADERILSERRTALLRTFDARPCAGSGLHDLSVDLFLVTYRGNAIAEDILRENRRDLKTQMASLRFYDLTADCPTNAGVLLFGKDPLNWLPGAFVQFVRYDRTKLTDPVLNERSFGGDLLTVLRELDAFVPTQLQSRPMGGLAMRERNQEDYPLKAIKELLMNAIVHRSYETTSPVRFYWFSDRIEIQNPGGLYGEATPQNFPRQNTYRNPVLAEAMKVLGYVNKFGRGVMLAQEALAANGSPQAEFTFEPHYFLATIRRAE